MQKGGYQIIDLKYKEITKNVGMVFNGIHNAIESTKKPILISGLNFEGYECHDFFATVDAIGSSYFINNFATNGYGNRKGIVIEISDTDVVTIRQLT